MMKRKAERTPPPIVTWTHIESLQTDLILIESDDSQPLEDSLFHALITPTLTAPAYKEEEDEETPSDQMQEDLTQRQQKLHQKDVSKEGSQRESEGEKLKQVFSERKEGRRGCNCRSSHCSKNYCECLRMGLTCIEGLCSCLHCQNHEETPAHNTNSRRMALEDGFRGCKCKKSQCLKRYCECHNGGRKCGLACQCIHCYNRQQQEKYDILRKLRKAERQSHSKHIHPLC